MILQIMMLRSMAELKSEPICYNDLIVILVILILKFAIKFIKRITSFQIGAHFCDQNRVIIKNFEK